MYLPQSYQVKTSSIHANKVTRITADSTKLPSLSTAFERFGGIITVKKLLVANFDSYIHWVFSFRFGELRYTYHRIAVAANISNPPDDT